MIPIEVVMHVEPADDSIFIQHPVHGWTLCDRELWGPQFFDDSWSRYQLWLLYREALKESRGY